MSFDDRHLKSPDQSTSDAVSLSSDARMTEADASAREALSSDQKREASLLVSELIVAPIPPASELKEYEHVVPGSADRIIAMAENEQRHRHRMETFGLLSGFVLGIVGLAGGLFIVATKDSVAANIAGTVITGGSLVALVHVFVVGKRRQADAGDD